MKVLIIASTLALVVTAACSSSKGAPEHTGATGAGASRTVSPAATVDPGNFAKAVSNDWFPLRVGETREYRGQKDGKAARESFVVATETKTILGVTCTVIRDNLYLDGTLAERTEDWYAQDNQGNVWYFGEDTAELDDKGAVTSREGSWTAGKDGAQAGIYITARPQLGVDYLQEYYKGHAEDHFVASRTGVAVTVPYGTFADTLETTEHTPLEPDVIDHKYYAKGVGVVKEASEDGDERLELVAYKR